MAIDESSEETPNERPSAGHKLGQLVGNWVEEYFVWPLIQDIADNLLSLRRSPSALALRPRQDFD